jgi:tRNA 2-thiouridine synthesizing protein E
MLNRPPGEGNKEAVMNSLKVNDKTYQLDADEFLMDFSQWDKDFANEIAVRVKIPDGLTGEHWDVIDYIRRIFEEEKRCPLIYETCRVNRLSLKDFEDLFPSGYLRGACKLAGITYKEGFIGHSFAGRKVEYASAKAMDKYYQVNGLGFLVNPYDWDEHFAELKAFELKMPEHLTDNHWQIIYYLRDYYKTNFVVPTIFVTCRENNLSLDELERLFPDGYHRGAIKIAGLRVR